MSKAPRPCEVTGSQKLPSNSGPTAICDAIERAFASRLPALTYHVRVEVLSRSALKASVVIQDKTIADQRLSVVDRDLNPQSIERFAQRLAEAAAKATNT